MLKILKGKRIPSLLPYKNISPLRYFFSEHKYEVIDEESKEHKEFEPYFDPKKT